MSYAESFQENPLGGFRHWHPLNFASFDPGFIVCLPAKVKSPAIKTGCESKPKLQGKEVLRTITLAIILDDNNFSTEAGVYYKRFFTLA